MKWIPSETYRQILSSVPIACVDVAIVSEGRILLVERTDAPAKGQLWLPGGRVHKGELLKEAASRKAIEEVGIRCHVGPILLTSETIFEDGPNDIAVHSINTCFFLFPKDKDVNVKLDGHHAHYSWISAISPNLHSYVRSCLSAAGLC